MSAASFVLQLGTFSWFCPSMKLWDSGSALRKKQVRAPLFLQKQGIRENFSKVRYDAASAADSYQALCPFQLKAWFLDPFRPNKLWWAFVVIKPASLLHKIWRKTNVKSNQPAHQSNLSRRALGKSETIFCAAWLQYGILRLSDRYIWI